MKLFNCLMQGKPTSDVLPEFIREVQDLGGVRVLRLQGPVGKEIGRGQTQVELDAARDKGVFERSILFDFKGTTGWDFTTVSYLVEALRHRMAARAQVGIINAPPQLIAELEIAKLAGLFRIFGSEQEALAALSGR